MQGGLPSADFIEALANLGEEKKNRGKGWSGSDHEEMLRRLLIMWGGLLREDGGHLGLGFSSRPLFNRLSLAGHPGECFFFPML